MCIEVATLDLVQKNVPNEHRHIKRQNKVKFERRRHNGTQREKATGK